MNEKIYLVVVLFLFAISGCCPRATIPATIQADIERIQQYNQRLEAENAELKGRIDSISARASSYAGGVESTAGDALTDLERLDANNKWLEDFLDSLTAELREPN